MGSALQDDEDGISDEEKSDPRGGLYRSALGCIDTEASG